VYRRCRNGKNRARHGSGGPMGLGPSPSPSPSPGRVLEISLGLGLGRVTHGSLPGTQLPTESKMGPSRPILIGTQLPNYLIT
jgi:hypothetical protein